MKETDIIMLVDSLMRAMESALEESDAREKYDGYDWGYHGYPLIQAKEEAAERFGKLLADYIDQRIQVATGARP